MGRRDFARPRRHSPARKAQPSRGNGQLSLYEHGRRLACIDVPALPLQLLLKKHPEWSEFPAAVVDRDAPQGRILWVNRKAWNTQIRPGRSYAEGLSLDGSLRADVISEDETSAGVDLVAETLEGYSPEIEPSSDFPGVFWVNAAGMTLLYPSLHDWIGAIAKSLEERGFACRACVGFTRFSTFALARSSDGHQVIKSAEEEENAAHRVPLERLGLAPTLLSALAKLGIRTVGTFLRLPASGLLERFGQEAYHLHRLASGDLWSPLVPRPPQEPIEGRTVFDDPVSGAFRLLRVIETLLEPMAADLQARGKAITALHILLVLDTHDNVIETVRPAEPTNDEKTLLELVELRLQAGKLPAGVIELELRGEAVDSDGEQLSMSVVRARRDLAAADRALARVRAQFGDEAVVHAREREGHLPEAGFSWEPMAGMTEAKPRKVAVRPLVRRVQNKPTELPRRPNSERNDNWLMNGLDYGPIIRMLGPYVVSGGWWMSTVHREYHFLETGRGDLLWTYYDRRRRRWFLQGRVD